MDKGTIHRLAVICKDYYVIRTIDDLFVFSGADLSWWCQPKTITSSERMGRFYGWIEGIQKYTPEQLDTILEKVSASIVHNEAIPDADRIPLEDVLEDLARVHFEKDIELESFLSTLARMLANAGLAREVAIITAAKPRLEWMSRDGWAETDFYALYLAIPYKLYAQIEGERQDCERKILQHVQTLCMAIPKEYIERVNIAPQMMQDEQWREKALAWLTGEKVNNQGRVRSDNIAPRTFEGLQFRSQPEIYLFQALRALGVTIAPLPVFLRERRRIEPDIVVLKSGIVMVVEVDGDTFHHETPAEAYNRTTMLENEGAHVVRVNATECETPDKATACAKKLLQTLIQLKESRR